MPSEPGWRHPRGAGAGDLERGPRWNAYRKLQRELSFLEAKEDRALRQANRKQWIAVSKANRAGKGKVRVKEW